MVEMCPIGYALCLCSEQLLGVSMGRDQVLATS